MSAAGSEEKEVVPSEDNIRVICRFRPLNDSEEKAGSKFIVKFPPGSDDQCVSIAVSHRHDSFAQRKRILKGFCYV